MIEIAGNIFDYLKDESVDAICIFTNGITNSYGQAMAGAGQAGSASHRWHNFRYNLGTHLRKNGNVVGLIGKVSFFKSADNENMEEANMLESQTSHNGKICILSFPTKNHFNKPSITELIVQSAKDLVKMSNELNFKKIILGRPGCGVRTGKLSYEQDVKPLISNILDDRYIIVNND